MNSKINRVYEALVINREKLTAKQIAYRYNVSNPYNIVYTLRNEGYPITLSEYTNSKGRTTQKYAFGNPSRETIAMTA